MGVGDPDAAAMKVAAAPDVTVVDVGFDVTDGGTLTVNVAGVVVADPAALVNTARYSYPLLVGGTLLIVKVVDVAPATSENVPPPLVLTLNHDPSPTNQSINRTNQSTNQSIDQSRSPS